MSAVAASVLDAAIDWQLCLGSGEASTEQRHEFSLWIAAHPEHARVWQQLNGLDQHFAAAAAAPVRQALLRRPRRHPGATALSLVLGGALLLGVLAQQRPLSDYLADEMTARGEQREVLLADRSQVRLNSASALDIDFSDTERVLHLRSGEILVQTAPGDSRPFVVVTAQGRLRALGTRFLVRREGESTRLTVLKSAVAARPLEGTQERIIPAGQQVLIQRQRLAANQPAAAAADAWSHGMLVVENQRLGDLLATLGEYRSGYLGVDPAIADLRISGSFPLHNPDQALAALPPSVPVRIERLGTWWARVLPAEK